MDYHYNLLSRKGKFFTEKNNYMDEIKHLYLMETSETLNPDYSELDISILKKLLA